MNPSTLINLCGLTGCTGLIGWLCSTCKDAVATKYRNNPDLTFEHLVDSKGKLGVHGQRKNGKRSPLVSLSTNEPKTPSIQYTPQWHNDHIYSARTSSSPSPVKSTSRLLHSKTPMRKNVNFKPRMLSSSHHETTVQNRKRPTVQHDETTAPLVPAKKTKRNRKSLLPPPDLPDYVTFLGHKSTASVVSQILSLCSSDDVISVSKACTNLATVRICVDDVAKRLRVLQNENHVLNKRLNVPTYGPLTQPQRQLLSKMVKNRQTDLDKDGLLVVRHPRGKPTKFLEVPSTQLSSSSASKSTKVRRAKLIERLTDQLSKVTSNGNSDNDVESQMVTLIKRNKDLYAKAANEAGLKIVKRFKRETVLALRSVMTQTLWRMLRRVIKDEVGHDVFITEDNLKKEIVNMEFEYECGTYKSPVGDSIEFVRVVNVAEVVKKTVKDLYDAGLLQPLENVPDETLWVHISADNGGKSTKLIMQIINVNEKGRHSIKLCKLLGFYEGKDNHQNVEAVFGPTVQQLKDVVDNIEALKLLRPDFTNRPLQRKPAPDDLNFTPLQPLNLNNGKVSSECQHCKKHLASLGQKNRRRLCARRRRRLKRKRITEHQEQTVNDVNQSVTSIEKQPPDLGMKHNCVPMPSTGCEPLPETDHHHEQTGLIFTKGRLTVGGDWEFEARFVGLSGPNGKHFCNHCLAMTVDMPKNKPHALHILPKYQNKTDNRSKVLPDDDDFLRTFDSCHAKNAEFMASGGNKKDAQNFYSCIYPPLMTGPEFNMDTISTSPLHISLGLGLQILNIVENCALGLDKEIKEAHGVYTPFDTVYNHEKTILKKCQHLNSKVDELKDQIATAKKGRVDIVKDRAKFFKKKRNGEFVYTSDLAKGVRDLYENLGKSVKDYETQIDKTKQALKKQERELTKTATELEQLKGPFKAKFDKVLDSLHLKRVVYHSGSLIGPDVRKLVSYQNIPKFASIFNTVAIDTPNGTRVFSSHNLRVKIITLLTKFAQCYELYNKNRTLCAHEVEILAMRCVSFGNWFPVNFPEENLKRKLHNLCVEVPRQVRRLCTIGMITEQTIESLHPYINKLNRMFCTVQDKCAKAKLICRQHNMFSSPTLPLLK